MSIRLFAALFVLALVWPTATAVAQPLGTFRWQIQPYCNVIVLNVSQQGGIYTLDGTDDRCGGGNQSGSAVGIAYMTPLGLVGFGITTVLPDGTPVHTEATINISSLNGTWRDSAGNNGTFIYTPGAGIPGAPRLVPSGGIAPASITTVQIAPSAVTAAQLAVDSVTSANIVNNSITTADLAAPAGSAFTGGGGFFTLTATPSVVRSLSVTAPSAGRVIVNAQGLFGNSAATLDYAGCLITTGTTITVELTTFMSEATAASMHYVPFALTRGFDVGAGVTTFNVVCYEIGGDVNVQYPMMTAIFTPQ